MLDQDELISAVGTDYTLLRDLLAVGKWKEADLETSAVMLRAAGREMEGWCDSESIQKFPCQDLRTVDQLWVKYSKGHFGFSVQTRIYFKMGQDFGNLAECVGWRVLDHWLDYSERTFDVFAPAGHLPSGGVGYKRWTRWVEASYAALAHRLAECDICC